MIGRVLTIRIRLEIELLEQREETLREDSSSLRDEIIVPDIPVKITGLSRFVLVLRGFSLSRHLCRLAQYDRSGVSPRYLSLYRRPPHHHSRYIESI